METNRQGSEHLHTYSEAEKAVYSQAHSEKAPQVQQQAEAGQTHTHVAADGTVYEHTHLPHSHTAADGTVYEHTHTDVTEDGTVYEHTHVHAGEDGHTHAHTHTHENTKAVLNRLSRIIGHMQSIKRMVEDGRDCSEVLIQLSAVRAALNSTGKVILQDHIQHCLVDAIASGDMQEIEELNRAIDRFIK